MREKDADVVSVDFEKQFDETPHNRLVIRIAAQGIKTG